MDDERIVELYWQRSERAIKESSRKFGGYCLSIARRILTDREAAEECLNDTWLRAWNAMPPHKPCVLSVFLGKITRRLSLTRLERQRAQKRGGGAYEAALEELGAPREGALYVGDSEVDVETARRSGLDLVGVSWGFRGRELLRQAGAEHIADSVQQLWEFVR